MGAFLSGFVLGAFVLAVVVVLTINAKQTKGWLVKGAVCGFEPCELDAKCNGLCWGHRTQQYRGQELRPLLPYAGRRTAPTCSFEGCERPNRGGGLCDGHRRQRDRGKSLRRLGLPRGRPRRERGDALRVP